MMFLFPFFSLPDFSIIYVIFLQFFSGIRELGSGIRLRKSRALVVLCGFAWVSAAYLAVWFENHVLFGGFWYI